MGLSEWVAESVERYRRESPTYATKRTYQELLKGVLRRVPNASGTPIWDRDWDVLLVLDACRYDAFHQRYADAGWYAGLDAVLSVGSASPEWMDNTFSAEYEDELARTSYITGNPYSADHVDPDRLGHLDEVWRRSWDSDTGTIRPEPLTASAVEHYREDRPDRMIVHYMQPHWPYVTDPVMYGFDPTNITGETSTENPFDKQNRGELSREEHFDRYLDNLEFIVDRVRETLLRAIDAESVVLTADHGTLFGEYGLYKHPANMPMRGIRRVPWVTTTAEDDGRYDPEPDLVSAESVDAERDQQLRDLGYVE